MSGKTLWLLAGAFLLYWTYHDLRCGMISVKSCLIAAGTGIAARVMFLDGAAANIIMRGSGADWTDLVYSLIPGLFVMGMAVVSGERVGKGDAWMLSALGALLGVERCLELFVTALAAAVLFAALCCLAGRCKGRGGPFVSSGIEEEGRVIPFAPCLMIAYVLWSVRS